MTGPPLDGARRRVLGPVVAALACLFVVLGIPAPASAHATLISTDPVDGAVLDESPGAVTFTFDETVSLPADGAQVFDHEGEQIESQATGRGTEIEVGVPDELADGSYVVAWRAVSADGHPIAGSLTFSVGEPSLTVASPDLGPDGTDVGVPLSVLQGAGYLGLMVAVGIAIFLVLILHQDARADHARRRLRTLAHGGSVVAVVAAVASIPLVIVKQQDLRLEDLLRAGTWGQATSDLLVSVGLLTVGLVVLRPALDGAQEDSRRRLLLGCGGALAVVSPAVTGHSRAFSPEPLVMAVDVLHVLAGSVWLGGLLGLAMTLPTISGRGRHAAVTLTRFSTLAAGLLAALVGTGAVLAWRIVAGWENLFQTRYGLLLMIKIGLVAVAAGIAGWNRFVLLRRVDIGGEYSAQRGTGVRIGRVVSVEAAVLVCVIGLTGFLTNQSPRPAVIEIPDGRTGVSAVALGEDYKVLATLTPGRRGPNTLLIQVQDLTGEPVEPTRLPTVSVSSPALDLGDVRIVSTAAGTYRAEVVLPSPGTWEIELSQPVSRFENPVAKLRVQVS